MVTLALLSGFAANSQLVTHLNAPDVPTTPCMLARLQALRSLIGFEGEIFSTRAVRRGR